MANFASQVNGKFLELRIKSQDFRLQIQDFRYEILFHIIRAQDFHHLKPSNSPILKLESGNPQLLF
jgi:hypothetical protein